MDATSSNDSTYADQAHQEYLAETKRLVDQEIEGLFSMIAEAAARGGTAPAGSAGQGLAVTRDGRALQVSNGARAATFAVQAITDLPEGADRAHAFPTSQAVCTMQGPGGATERWELHRVGAGDSPSYAWLIANTTTPVGPEDIARALQPLSA